MAKKKRLIRVSVTVTAKNKELLEKDVLEVKSLFYKDNWLFHEEVFFISRNAESPYCAAIYLEKEVVI
jgi:MoaA/NifB/PqqE/SkfB family radical SAM enzyme